MERRRVLVHGRVQGVFFRDSCRSAALGRNVSGWVRNSPEGCVEAVFEGEADDVEAMCEWCRSGPSYARVDRVEVIAENPRGESGFAVRF